MARPKKNTVDYFPHPCEDGTRMFVMEQKFGDKGYCCYYKLLARLGATDGHFIDFSVPKNRMFFSAQLRTDEGQLMEMLDCLVELGTLDRELWEEKRIAWCQEFVDSISDVYSRIRRTEIPSKTSLLTSKPTEEEINSHENTQSKVKESKVKESKVNDDDVIENFSNEIFSEMCLQDQIWIESMCRIHKKVPGDFPVLLKTFTTHQVTIQSLSQSLRDFKQHFNSWIRKNNCSLIPPQVQTGAKNYD